VKAGHRLIERDDGYLAPAYHDKPMTIRMLGLRLHCLTYAEMFSAFDWWISDKTRPALTVALVNVNCCVSALTEPRIFECYRAAGIRGIDSMPFLWLARWLTRRPLDRLYAPDMLLEVAARAQSHKYSFFLLGGMPGAGESIAAKLLARFPGVNIVGIHCPPFRPLTPEDDRALVDAINAAQPDILWVGLGSPKQDLWIHEHRSQLRGCVIVASGATFDFFSGRIKQAPKWIRQSGFEWLFRLCHDWRRLWRRYTVYNLVFVMCFILEIVGIKRWHGGAAGTAEGS
jgi:N-acetylglucosaminyldiphosphoundecaprenol N-acetyl-beta-D-mannosaminyltransferase